MSKVTAIESARRRRARKPWHLCSTCYHFIPNENSDENGWCNYAPDTVESYASRQGCSVWECVGCGGAHDDEVDHMDCMDAIGVCEVQEC
jgi:hypothetical protein